MQRMSDRQVDNVVERPLDVVMDHRFDDAKRQKEQADVRAVKAVKRDSALKKRLAFFGVLERRGIRRHWADSYYKRNADQLGMEVIGMLWEVGVERFC